MHLSRVDQVKSCAWRGSDENIEERCQKRKHSHEGEECPVHDHPTSRCETGEAHVESDNGHLDPGDCLVEHG